MNGTQFDRLARRFAGRRKTAGNQDGATPDTGRPSMLFVQSFESGTIAPVPGGDGRYTVTLEHGLGQTLYFSDRPDRLAGAAPTGQFLDGLGFTPESPPNAAILTRTASGEEVISVVELFAPAYDPAGPTLTYEMATLAGGEEPFGTGAMSDLAAVTPEFGATHLFIDDCGIRDILCVLGESRRTLIGTIPHDEFGGICYNTLNYQCLPCQPDIPERAEASDHWTQVCNERFPDCAGDKCVALNV